MVFNQWPKLFPGLVFYQMQTEHHYSHKTNTPILAHFLSLLKAKNEAMIDAVADQNCLFDTFTVNNRVERLKSHIESNINPIFQQPHKLKWDISFQDILGYFVIFSFYLRYLMILNSNHWLYPLNCHKYPHNEMISGRCLLRWVWWWPL